MTITRMRRGAAACLAIAIFSSACHSLRVVASNELGPIGRLHASNGPRGAMIATMGQGTQGGNVLELPCGDILLSGEGETGFLQRVSPEGRTLWTMQACWQPDIASAGDDVIYASASRFLDAGGRAGDPEPARSDACGPRRPVEAPTSIARLDGRGAIHWKLDTGLFGSVLSAASEDHVFVLGDQGDLASGRRELLAVSPRGQIAWTWQGRARSMTSAWSPLHHVLIVWAPVDERPRQAPRACTLTALDEATGRPVWETTIKVDDSTVAEMSFPKDCSPERILVSPRGGIFLAEGSITGFDLSTGAVRWQRPIDVTNFVPSARVEPPAAPFMPLLLEYQRYPSDMTGYGYASNPFVVALDPVDGREVPVDVFRGDLLPDHADVSSDLRVEVEGFAWGRNAVVATGSLRGRLLVDGLRADSESSVKTLCVEPGYGWGGVGAPGPCRFGSERVREYRPTLFVARVPLAG